MTFPCARCKHCNDLTVTKKRVNRLILILIAGIILVIARVGSFFTERSGDTATRFATATTGAASEEVPTRAAFGAPKARIEFNAPVLIDTYSPVVGDEF